MSSDLRFPSIDGLRAFEAAARQGSFERAADELNVTASAVSKRVAALEDLLGAPVFVRGARSLSLTAAGREYLQQVSQALALLTSMPQHQRQQQRLRKLRVTAPPTFARQVLVPRLESFTLAQPDIELEVVLSIPFLDAPPSEANLEIRHGQGLPGRVLLGDVVLPLASPKLLERLPPLRQAIDLAHAPLLRTPLEPWAPWFAAVGLNWPEPASGPKLVDLGLTLEAAVSAQGVALGRPTLARHWLESGALVPALPGPRTTAAPTHLYTLLPHSQDEATTAFAQWLVQQCAQLEQEAQALLSGLA
jgi:LysR family glycine cleavage system transcriptional activator